MDIVQELMENKVFHLENDIKIVSKQLQLLQDFIKYSFQNEFKNFVEKIPQKKSRLLEPCQLDSQPSSSKRRKIETDLTILEPCLIPENQSKMLESKAVDAESPPTDGLENQENLTQNYGINETNKSDDIFDTQDIDETDDTSNTDETDDTSNIDETHEIQVHEMDKTGDTPDIDETHEMDETQEIDETGNTYDVEETNETQEIGEPDESQEVDEADETQEIDETDDTHHIDETGQVHEIGEMVQVHEIGEMGQVHEIDEIDDTVDIREGVEIDRFRGTAIKDDAEILPSAFVETQYEDFGNLQEDMSEEYQLRTFGRLIYTTSPRNVESDTYTDFMETQETETETVALNDAESAQSSIKDNAEDTENGIEIIDLEDEDEDSSTHSHNTSNNLPRTRLVLDPSIAAFIVPEPNRPRSRRSRPFSIQATLSQPGSSSRSGSSYEPCIICNKIYSCVCKPIKKNTKK